MTAWPRAAASAAATPGVPAPAAPRTAADLTFDQPVPRGVVHKSGIGEVFLTDCVQLTPEQFAIAGELPRSHAFLSDHAAAPRGAALMAAVELFRQSVYVVSHGHWGVPLDAKYVLRGFHARLTPHGAALDPARPTPVIIDAHVAEAFTYRGARCGARMELELVAVDGPSLGSFEISFSWMSPARWEAMRAKGGANDGAPPAAPPREASPPAGLVAPEAVGRSHPSNVVLADPVVAADGRVTGVLRTDPYHVPLYDHPGDHVSGMALAEGWRQLALWAAVEHLGCTPADLVVDDFACAFSAVAEFDWEVTCVAEVKVSAVGITMVQITAAHDGAAVGHATLALRRLR